VLGAVTIVLDSGLGGRLRAGEKKSDLLPPATTLPKPLLHGVVR
jgi:hypothetical protein